jgi:hypothetical protein
MQSTVNSEDKPNTKHYWRFMLPVAFILALMVKFPVRFGLPELTYTVFFYATISLICLAVAIHCFRRFRKRGYRLISVILLCAVLSEWQVFDLLALRTGRPAAWGFGPTLDHSLSDYEGLAYYGLRFPNKAILCNVVYERYFGNQVMAVTVEINRDASWFACGG